MSKLLETQQLVDLFVHAHWYGGMERHGVPISFPTWSALSMVAGVVGDRVWLEGSDGTRTYPNLYVVLVAPSGAGKGVSIDPVVKYTQPLKDIIRVAPSKMTSASCIDFLTQHEQVANGDGTKHWKQLEPKAYLIHEEMVYCIGEKNIARSWMTFVTAHFKSPLFFMESTRSSGVHKLESPAVINWLGGTTQEWLRQVMSHTDILAGFGPRVTWVCAGYGKAVYGLQKYLPPDFDAVDQYIQGCVMALAQIPPGPMKMDREAFNYLDRWLATERGDPPVEQDVRAFFQRQGDLAVKVSMVHCLQRMQGRVIQLEDVQFARGLLEQWMKEDVPEIIAISLADKYHAEIERVGACLKKHTSDPLTRGMTSSELMKKVRMSSRIVEGSVNELRQRGLVTVLSTAELTALGLQSAVRYKWIGRK